MPGPRDVLGVCLEYRGICGYDTMSTLYTLKFSHVAFTNDQAGLPKSLTTFENLPSSHVVFT